MNEEELNLNVEPSSPKVEIPYSLYNALKEIGIIHIGEEDARSVNVGASDYSQHLIQPWSIWMDWKLNPWDADIVKRVLRNKKGDSRILDYEKIIHVCQERIRQLRSDEK